MSFRGMNGQYSIASAVAERQFCDLAFLSQVAVDAMFLHRDLEHLTGRGAVDVTAVCEDLLTPDLTGKPCQHSGLDGREVCHDELAVFLRHECRPDQLRECVRHILIEHLHRVEVTGADQTTGLSQIWEMVLREVLHLDNAASPATGPVGSEELKHPTGTAIGTHGFLHGLILPDGGLGKLLAEQEHLLQLRRRGLQDLSHFLFAEGVHLQTVVCEPLLHLDHAVGVLQRGQVFHGIDKMDKNNRLLSVVKAFSELDLDPHTIDNVKMGYIFEELIRKFSENAEAGDHYTGRDIIKLMVNILLAEGCDDIFDDGKVITILESKTQNLIQINDCPLRGVA